MYQTKTIAGILEPVAQQVNLFNNLTSLQLGLSSYILLSLKCKQSQWLKLYNKGTVLIQYTYVL